MAHPRSDISVRIGYLRTKITLSFRVSEASRGTYASILGLLGLRQNVRAQQAPRVLRSSTQTTQSRANCCKRANCASNSMRCGDDPPAICKYTANSSAACA